MRMNVQPGLQVLLFTAGLIVTVFASLVESGPLDLSVADNSFQISQAWALQFDAEMGRDSMNLEQSETIRKREITEGLNLGEEMDELQMPLVSGDLETNISPRRVRQVVLPYRDNSPPIRANHNW